MNHREFPRNPYSSSCTYFVLFLLHVDMFVQTSFPAHVEVEAVTAIATPPLVIVIQNLLSHHQHLYSPKPSIWKNFSDWQDLFEGHIDLLCSFLDAPLLVKVAKLNRRWNLISERDIFWAQLCVKKFHVHPDSFRRRSKSAKFIFRNSFQGAPGVISKNSMQQYLFYCSNNL